LNSNLRRRRIDCLKRLDDLNQTVSKNGDVSIRRAELASATTDLKQLLTELKGNTSLICFD
jgi:hypothetical protein